ncbi:hypothetical protein OJF2_77110 [Aquisphaera giovannonii]|uniref:PEP-CTERM protein-sorting domain-containing protein n=1 Tax=Aquisphaera giovannonii TaxID=406548 RepID=A0A5B9WFP8_9BACT|nr:hypothetical protein [Aquisphaera giovannonii]QEH39099.1 hypothetical protein OJF2_77110 [Aquisphaera giovannonii]
MSRRLRRLVTTLALPCAVFLVGTGPARGDILFFDDFNGPPLGSAYRADLPIAPDRYQAHLGPGISYVGAPTYHFEAVDGATTLHLQSVLGDVQRAGWSSAAAFSTGAPIVFEARFNTMTQSPTTGIDELLEIWLLDANNLNHYDVVALSAPDYGSARIFSAYGSLTSAGLDTRFSFSNNTWYRMILSGGPATTIRASIYADDGTTELIGVDLGHTLADLGGSFRIGLSQSVGLPGGAFPTNSAVDYLRLTASGVVPEPGSFVPLAIGGVAVGLRLRARRPKKAFGPR